MYHRFIETKYPSTNIQMDVFMKQIEVIKNLDYKFLHPQDFEDNFNIPKTQKKFFSQLMMLFYHFI